MKQKYVIKKGECFFFSYGDNDMPKDRFSIAETQGGYTLYKSIACNSVEEGNNQWKNLAAGSDAPTGWKACSDAISADTQHDVYDVVNHTYFYLKGMTDDQVTIIY